MATGFFCPPSVRQGSPQFLHRPQHFVRPTWLHFGATAPYSGRLGARRANGHHPVRIDVSRTRYPNATYLLRLPGASSCVSRQRSQDPLCLWFQGFPGISGLGTNAMEETAGRVAAQPRTRRMSNSLYASNHRESRNPPCCCRGRSPVRRRAYPDRFPRIGPPLSRMLRTEAQQWRPHLQNSKSSFARFVYPRAGGAKAKRGQVRASKGAESNRQTQARDNGSWRALD